jgi:hypothetical protein
MSFLSGILAVGGALMSKRAAEKQTASAERSEAAQLDFAKEQYADWQSVYGPLQDNLAEYYSGLDSEFYEAVGLESQQLEQQNMIRNIEERMAQSGIDSRSGIAQSLTAQAELAGAEQRAAIRRDAPRAVAEDKTRFLQIGLGQNPASSLQNVLSQQAMSQRNLATQQQMAAGQAIQSAVTTIGNTGTDLMKGLAGGGM